MQMRGGNGISACGVVEQLEGRWLLAAGAFQVSAVDFQAVGIAASPVANQVYVADADDSTVLVLDTDQGRITSSLHTSSQPNHLAVSPDGQELYVVEAWGTKIEVFATASQQLLRTFNYGFTLKGIAIGAHDRVYTWDDSNSLQIDGQNGEVLSRFGYAGMLGVSPDGTRLANCYGQYYDISGTGSPVLWDNCRLPGSDFLAVDSELGRVYTATGGIYGVSVTYVASGQTIFWPGKEPYGYGVAFSAAADRVFGANYMSIREYRRSDGNVMADYSVGWDVKQMAPTPNGRVAFITSSWTGTSAGDRYGIGMTGEVLAPWGATAQLNQPVPVITAANLGQATTEFSVHYSNASGLDLSTIDGDELTINGPYVSITPRLVSVAASEDRTSADVVYDFAAPGSAWNADDNGDYSINLLAGTVRDAFGMSNADAALGVITADLPAATEIGRFGMVAGVRRSFVLVEPDSDRVTFDLTGGGVGVLDSEGTLALSETTEKSVLSISVKRGIAGDGYYSLAGISATGLLKAVSASKVFVDGQLAVNEDEWFTGAASVSIDVAGFTDGGIDTHWVPIRSLKLLDWRDTDEEADQVVAPWIGAITVSGRKDNPRTAENEWLAGNWEADVITSWPNRGVAIGTMKVAGDVNGASVWAAGTIKSVSARGGLVASRVAAADGIGAVTVAEMSGSDVLVGVSEDFTDRFATAGAFDNPGAKLGKLSVTGRKLPKGVAHPAYVVDSHISAALYGTVSLVNVPEDTPLVPLLHVGSDTGVLKVKSLSEEMVVGGTWKGGVVSRPGQVARPGLVEVVG